MMTVRIYKPARTAMQSGKARTRVWVLEHIADAPRSRDPLMGWTGSADTRQQVKLQFESREAAVAYAKKHGLAYRVEEEKTAARQKKSYAENFRYDRPRP